LVDCRSKNLGCIEEIPCSGDCAPTSSPTKQKTTPPTKVPTRSLTENPSSSPTKQKTNAPTPIQNTDSPTCTGEAGDAKCFRQQKTVNGFTLVKVTLSTRDAFSMDNTCKSEGCYQKKKCNINSKDACFVLRECTGDGCFEEVLCGCVRKKEVNIGFKYEFTGSPGFVYKTCARDENCFERVTCEGGRNCGQLVDCRSKNLGCIEEIPCSSDCAPTSSPTKKTKSPTKVPTRSLTENPSSTPTKQKTTTPTKVPTSSLTNNPTADQGDPWKCDGCKWMDKSAKVVSHGTDDPCSIDLKPKKVMSKDGKCEEIISENQCRDLPCEFKYKFKYKITNNCKAKKMCNIIVADAYTAGASPPTPEVYPVVKNQGLFKPKKYIKVDCLCKTHTKVLKVECVDKKGQISAKSFELDYTCSECDMKWLAEK